MKNPTILVKYFVRAIPPLVFATTSVAAGCGDSLHPAGIQGTGESSPRAGETVRVHGTVTHTDFRPRGQRGFYLQGPDDGNPESSDALFVYTGDRFRTRMSSAPQIGEIWSIRGRVKEFHGLTELTSVSGLEHCGDAPLPPPRHPESPAEFLEGMRIALPASRIRDNFHLLRFGQLDVRVDDTLWHLEDGSDERELSAPPWHADNPLWHWNMGNRIRPLTGILTWRWGNWVVVPDGAPQPVARRPEPPGPPDGRTLRIVTWNLENLFNGRPDGTWGPRGPAGRTDWLEKRQKTATALADLGAAMYLVQEIENDRGHPPRALAELTRQLNRQTGRDYRVLQPMPSGEADVITNAFVYDSARLRPAGELREIATRPRPTLVQTFRQNTSGLQLTLANVHLKSRPGCSTPECTPERAEALRQIARNLTATGPEHPVILAGDFNTLDGENLWRHLEQAGWQKIPASGPTYWYRGRAQRLDHGWIPDAIEASVTARVVTGHAERVPLPPGHALYAPGSPWGASDHNPLLIDLTPD